MYKDVCFLLCCFSVFQLSAGEILDSPVMEFNKAGVIYKFMHMDQPLIDNWLLERFPSWEPETFEVFDIVKDPNGIAIDLGAWIGTTSIWLAKNFQHVVAVEPDRQSLLFMQRNLEASDCFNVSICPSPIATKPKLVTFGPRGEALNEAMSYIKTNSNHKEDYVI